MAVPVIRSRPYAYAQVGRLFQYKILASRGPTSFGVIGTLPDGLTIDLLTGFIGGFPSTPIDPYDIQVTASNSDGTSLPFTVTFHIYPADYPFFLGPLGSSGQIGIPFALQLLWSGTPTSYAMPVVPSGLTFHTDTGILDGIPDTPQESTPMIVQATNGAGTGENVMGLSILTANNAPQITSPLTASGTVGVQFEYQITAINNPEEFGCIPILPRMILRVSGRIIWHPTVEGDYVFQISASNQAGTDIEPLSVHIAPAAGGGGGEPPPDPGEGGPGPEPPPELIAGGLSFGDAKDTLRLVVDNGVGTHDPRVMRRTNEAINELLIATDPRTNGRLVPVGTFIRANVVAVMDSWNPDPYLLLPPQMENALEVVVKQGVSGSSVYGDADISQGWYSIADPYTWINPQAAHDNPTVEEGLVPDPLDPTVLRRKLRYPGIEAGAVVSVIGKKRFIPIVTDGDFLIIQNIPAIKLMIQAIELRENRDMEHSIAYRAQAIQMLSDECFNHVMDPNRMQRRRGEFEKDLARYPQGTKGWIRARIALDNPMAQSLGKSEIDRLLDRAEMEAIRMGAYKGTIEEFDAEVFGGDVFLPERVESCLAINLNGEPLAMRSIFFQYLENGPHGWDNSCGGYVRDLGEERLGGLPRRKFRISGSITTGQCLKMVCKLRWIKKEPADWMTIRNLEALELLCEHFLYRRSGQINEAGAAYADAKSKLNEELTEYLKGIKHTVPFAVAGGLSMADLGEML